MGGLEDGVGFFSFFCFEVLADAVFDFVGCGGTSFR